MDQIIFDEQLFLKEIQEETKRKFLSFIEKYENYIAPQMKLAGFKRINRSERTVLFSFGEITFSRSRWKKGEEIRVPVDEKLGLEPYVRYSKELIYRLNYLSTFMSYRNVVEVFEVIQGLQLTKDSVLKATKEAGKLLKQQEENNQLMLKEENSKIKTDLLVVEGDGLWVKGARKKGKKKSGNNSHELTHFIVHTGIENEDKKRHVLKNKFEVISNNHELSKRKIIDLIYSHFELTPNTLLVTNSDGGSGYSKNFFIEFGKTFHVKKHIHFWDRFHVNKLIKQHISSLSPELGNRAFQSIRDRNKLNFLSVLDTAESLISNDSQLVNFERVKRQFINGFSYTHNPDLRGLTNKGIGVIESLHRKFSYRMKNRGMYWSEEGADTMSRMILLREEQLLRDLFFGDWKNDFDTLEEIPVFKFLSCKNRPLDYSLPMIKRSNIPNRKEIDLYEWTR